MIRIEKQKAPGYLNSEIVDLAIEKLEEFFSANNRSQKRYGWPFNKEIDNELKKYLHEQFHGKCGYCEIRIDFPELGVVDRYRPNDGVRDQNEFYQDLYWWLAFNWNNLIYCCKECHQYKANYFPIDGERMKNHKVNQNIEIPLLLNPYEDNPEEHIKIVDGCLFVGLTLKGEQTISLLRLNRENLLIEREKLKNKIDSLILNYIDKGKDSLMSPSDFQFLFGYLGGEIDFFEAHTFFGRHYIQRQSATKRFKNVLERFFPTVVFDEKKEDFSIDIDSSSLINNDYFPIEYIHIKNFKSIDDLRIDFKEDEINKKSWLFLLGENGVGKSSILQAIAIGLKLDKKFINEKIVESLIKKRKQTSEITIKERNSDNIVHTKLIRKSGTVEQSGRFTSYLIGYGSLRLSVDEIESESNRDVSRISYQNLFKPTKPLNDVTKWLRAKRKNDVDFFNKVAVSIKKLLPHDKSDTDLSIRNGEIVLGDSEKLFSELSDGYKSTITLALDIMMKLSDAQSDMNVMNGIVLIDELGNQLHPRWQMRIVKQLREVFPNINFIISTHHPLCLRGAEREEILLLKNLDNEVIINTELPDPSSLRIDQILASEFFGLNSLVDPEIEASFNRYYELLAKNDEVNPSERSEIDQLRGFLRNKKQLGNSLRDELMYTVLDRLLAEKVAFNKQTLDRNTLKEEAVQRVKDVWKNLNLDLYD
ncbi:AAA family ATPase [Chryseobacterium sp. JV274]|uniref:AAA family ATPase n=1 Tax=Chryseobacterium sp. JV274 TaxID=1932669 RepID=UPI000986BBC1|nr:AAA family ATPase [Chryseobacterium sp. JV274]